MPLRPLPFREVVRKLKRAGFAEVGQRGSHVKLVSVRPNGVRTTIVPRHREVQVGTIRSILRQSGLTPDEFDAL